MARRKKNIEVLTQNYDDAPNRNAKPRILSEERTQGSNAELVKQIETLFKTDRKKFLGFIRQRVRSQEEAEDILQDVFANVLAASANIEKPIENVSSWVFTAVRNRIIDSYRKKRAENFSDLQTPEQVEEGVDPFENFVSDYYNTPETDYLRKTIWEYIQEGLSELPKEQRDVFIRNEFDGISFREMAEETGININTLLARKRYAVLHLRKRLRGLYDAINQN
ncbi:MAG TPA: RNA polymerase sigma factor [Bacteroidota bacterium]|nr:RNA polymerase sigma factor [Candidatus Kapabacteria bacterium]HRS01711.1 RNA polymerase sigma factor [Bacteroidota bacterium]HRT67291.1 RNA polymerase sigma factor [Bacteroidota bacterium]